MSSNDPMSILLATTILALGGLGLYMYKSSDNEEDDNTPSENKHEETYNEDTLFSWFSLGDKDENEDNDETLEETEIVVADSKHRKRTGKTLKNRKSSVSSRRRY